MSDEQYQPGAQYRYYRGQRYKAMSPWMVYVQMVGQWVIILAIVGFILIKVINPMINSGHDLPNYCEDYNCQPTDPNQYGGQP